MIAKPGSRRFTGGSLVLALLAAGACWTPAQAGLNEWTSQGPRGVTVTALAINPQAPGVLYAGTDRGQVFRSLTRGAVWTALPAGIPAASSVSALVIHPDQPTTVYAGVAAAGGAGDDGRVFKSTDGGALWTRADAGLTHPVDALAIAPGTPVTLYAGTSAGLFQTADGGASWALNAGLAGRRITGVVVNPRAPATLYATSGATLLKSADTGQTWTAIDWESGATLPAPFIVDGLSVAVDPQAPDTVYLGYRGRFGGPGSPQATGGVLRSVNGGATWSVLGPGPGFVLALAVDPKVSGTLYAGTGSSVLKRTEASGAWRPVKTGLPATLGMPGVSGFSITPVSWVTALAIDPDTTTTLYVALQGEGVFGSPNGGESWNPRNSGMNAPISAMALDPRAPATLYAGGNDTGVFRSSAGGAAWNRSDIQFFGLGYFLVTALAVDPQVSAIVYAGSGGRLLKSDNGGSSFRAVLLASGAVVSLAADPVSPGTLYAGTTGGGAFKSLDGGKSWATINSGLPAHSGVTALAIDPATPSTIYAVTQAGVFRTTDAGGSWTPRGSGLPEAPVNAVAIDPWTPFILYAATAGHGVFKSTDGGASWFESGAGLSALDVKALVVDARTPQIVYAASGGQVFRSADRGTTWIPLSADLGTLTISSLLLTPSGGCLHAGTDAGVHSFSLQPDADCPPPSSLAAAVLPSSRSVQAGTAAAAFATALNAGAATALHVGISAPGFPGTFVYQTTDPATNAVTGTPNTPVDIPPGRSQTFVIAATSGAIPEPIDLAFTFAGSNTDPAEILSGLNTLLLSSSSTPVPDIVALAATAGNNGIVEVSGPSGAGAFAVATVNVGSAGAITASADTGSAALPISLALCETHPTTGLCISPVGPSVTVQINAGATPTFAIFVAGTGSPVAFDPAGHRVFVRFKDAGGTTRGSTSVSVRTQ